MASPSVAPSLGRWLLVVMLIAVIPLGAIGLWATQGAARSGRTLRRVQLTEQLDVTAREVAQAWDRQRADLLMLSENEPMRVALRGQDTALPAFVRRAFAAMSAFDRVQIRDRSGRARFVLTAPFASGDRSPSPRGQLPAVTVQLPITDLLNGDTLGTMDATVRLAAIIPAMTRPAASGGPLLQVVLPGDVRVRQGDGTAALFDDESVEWQGDRWTTVERALLSPPVRLMLAGTLSAFEQPFRQSATRSALALLVTSTLVVVVLVLITRRVTRDVERELAQQEALAAVGEFASELAHEVRNPLTAMRLDLQRAEEQVGDAAVVSSILPRVLAQIDRLDRAVSGALRVARSGSIEPEPVDLAVVLEAARRSAEPEFVRRRARVRVEPAPAGTLQLDGDAGALEQLFLNLLINAAQALAPDGEALVSAQRTNGHLEVTIADNGVGMTPEQLARTERPMQSSRRDGTGLGLQIARRIVASHHGALTFSSRAGFGTTVQVRLPAVSVH